MCFQTVWLLIRRAATVLIMIALRLAQFIDVMISMLAFDLRMMYVFASISSLMPPFLSNSSESGSFAVKINHSKLYRQIQPL